MRKFKFGLPLLFGIIGIVVSICATSVFADWGVKTDIIDPTTGSVAGKTGSAPVAYFGSRYFTTVESAVGAANNTGSTQTVYVIPGANPTITSSFTINSNITLSLPYDGTSVKISGNLPTSAKLAQPDSSLMMSKVTLASGVTITNNGTIIVGGEIAAGSGGHTNAGQTYNRFAQITMNDNSNIICNNGSKFTIYGYVQEGIAHTGDYDDEDDISSWPKISLYSGSTLNSPFIIHDYRGGSITSALNGGDGVMFFNEYEIYNIRPLVHLEYGAIFTVNTSLYANSSPYEANNIALIGNSSSYLFQMKENSLFTLKYNYGNDNNKNYDLRYKNFMDIRLRGNFAINKLTFSVAGVSLDTAKYRFGISYLFHIRLYNGTTNISNKIKLMAGAVLIVNPGASLTLGDCIIYTDYTDTSSDGHTSYPSGAAEPILMNNGTINATKLAGRIKVSEAEAALSASSTSISSSEHLGHSGSSLWTSCTYTTVQETLSVKLYKNGIVSSVFEPIGGGTYYSITDVNSNTGWFTNSGSISYNSNGGTAVANKSITLTSSGYTISANDLPAITKLHYTFSGWYLDSNLSASALGSVIYSSVTLYAKWTPVDYNVVYHFDVDFEGNPVSGNPTNNPSNPSTYNIDSSIPLYPASNGDLVFDGWYISDSYTAKISIINSDVVSSLSGDYTLNLYGRWYPADAQTFVITYVNTNTDDGCTCADSEEILSANLSTLVVPDLSPKNNDTSYSKYFDGWYLDSDFNTKYTSYEQITGSQSLYAKWLDKNIITLMVNGNLDFATVRYLKGGQTFTVPNASSYGLDVPAGYEVSWAITGGDLDGQVVKTGDNICLSNSWGQSITVDGSLTLKDMKLTVSVGANYKSVTVTVKRNSTTIYNNVSYTSNIYVRLNDVITLTLTAASNCTAGNPSATSGVTKSGNNFVVSGENPTITVPEATKSSSCLLPNTQVTLADGSIKEIKDVNQGDMVRVFNHETGEIDIAPVIFNEHDEATWQNVIYLEFSNGTKVGVISEHGFFDLNTMKYEYIDENNYQSFIGHNFYAVNEGGNSYETKLINAYVNCEFTECYSLPSYYHLDFFANELLSMPGGISGLFNIFDYADNLQYDQEKMNADIQTYGLFEYDDLAPLGVSEIMFDAYAGKYLKVALGKGLLTMDDLEYLINRYGYFTD